MVVVLMGVAGAGKTTVGELLAARLSWKFADADTFHSAANVEKMRQGIPLTDADRAPWLEGLRTLLVQWIKDGTNGVLACSALKAKYRKDLQVAPDVKFVYLKVSPDLLSQRLHARHGHYMTEKMLASQLEALEEPRNAIVIAGDGTPAKIVEEIFERLGTGDRQ